MSEELQIIPIGMRSTKYIEDLPYEVLVEIFSYLSFLELVNSVQHVSCRWHDVAQDDHLWRKLHYIPGIEDTNKEVVNILRQTPKLRTLVLDNRVVSSSVLFALRVNCSELRKLTFNITQELSKQSVRSLVKNCQKLEHLTFPCVNVNAILDAEMIGQLRNLKSLNIVGHAFHPHSALLRSIGDGCPLLQHLEIRPDCFNSAHLKYFMKMKQHQLQSIKISCSVEGKCTIPYLRVCKTLQKVCIYGVCGVHATCGFRRLRRMKNVTALTFSASNYAHLDRVLVSLFNNNGMSHLIELKFHGYKKYEDEFSLSVSICNNCPLLKVLGFYNCCGLTDRSLENLPKLQQLEYLDLSGCTGITDNGMDFVFRCKHLKHLNLFYCTQLTAQCMKQLTGVNLLETLILDSRYIEGLPLNLISTVLRKLRILSVNLREGVNLEALHQLRAEMPHLAIYDVKELW